MIPKPIWDSEEWNRLKKELFKPFTRKDILKIVFLAIMGTVVFLLITL